MLLNKGSKTMFIIVFTMIFIVATIIYIVFTKIDVKDERCFFLGGIHYYISLGN